MKKVKYHEMLPHEIVERREKFPAAFVPLGGLEWHSEHLAVGNDALKAEKLCELAAEKSGGFAFPTLWYGEPRSTHLLEVNYDQDGKICTFMKLKKERFTEGYAGFGKTAEEQVEFYTQLVYHLLVEMNTLEMRAVCLVCGHYPLEKWAAAAVEKFNAVFKDTQAFAGTEPQYANDSENAGGDHAAKWETSYLWYLRPNCVDMNVYLGKSADEPLLGVFGTDPRTTASIEIGRRGCELIVEGIVARAAELINRCKSD